MPFVLECYDSLKCCVECISPNKAVESWNLSKLITKYISSSDYHPHPRGCIFAPFSGYSCILIWKKYDFNVLFFLLCFFSWFIWCITIIYMQEYLYAAWSDATVCKLSDALLVLKIFSQELQVCTNFYLSLWFIISSYLCLASFLSSFRMWWSSESLEGISWQVRLLSRFIRTVSESVSHIVCYCTQ